MSCLLSFATSVMLSTLDSATAVIFLLVLATPVPWLDYSWKSWKLLKFLSCCLLSFATCAMKSTVDSATAVIYPLALATHVTLLDYSHRSCKLPQFLFCCLLSFSISEVSSSVNSATAVILSVSSCNSWTITGLFLQILQPFLDYSCKSFNHYWIILATPPCNITGLFL